jgi:hypothetical protein
VLLANQDLPKQFAGAIQSGPVPALDGPNLALVRLKPGAPPAAALASLQRIARASNQAFATAPDGAAGNGIVVQAVQRPAEIVNYKTIGITPTLLVSGLALGAIAALALTLLSSVRQRRLDLAPSRPSASSAGNLRRLWRGRPPWPPWWGSSWACRSA